MTFFSSLSSQWPTDTNVQDNSSMAHLDENCTGKAFPCNLFLQQIKMAAHLGSWALVLWFK
jgi:hypothetical protein